MTDLQNMWMISADDHTEIEEEVKGHNKKTYHIEVDIPLKGMVVSVPIGVLDDKSFTIA